MNLNCLRVFSGIQPTGIPHLGNYFGAIAHWIKIANERKVFSQNKQYDCDVPIYCIVDIHSYSSTSITLGPKLNDNIFSTAASLLAAGLNTNNCILYVQSNIPSHNYLRSALDVFTTASQLSRMSQFKDKSKKTKVVTNALLNYPVLQAADILLYRSRLVPVGEDQSQHIEYTRDIARKYNSFVGKDIFPLPMAIFSEPVQSRRIKSLRDPRVKMSKSDPDLKSFIEIVDETEVIVEKCKKALTDLTSEVYYDPEKRPGVSNLMNIYGLTNGLSMDEITKDCKGLDTAQFKLRLADSLIEKFKVVRGEYKRLIRDKPFLMQILKQGVEKASPLARETEKIVKEQLGSPHELDC